MPSFLKLVKNDQKNAVRNLAVCCGAIWRITEKSKGAQLQSLTCIIAPKMFWKIYFLYNFWCTQTCSFLAVFDDPYDFDNCCLRYIATCGKNYIDAHLHSRHYCGGILFKSLSYLYEVVRTNFSDDFGLFAIFDRNFAKIVAPPSDENENCVALLKGPSLLKKFWKPHQIDP